MRKRDELSRPDSCMAKARDNEMTFVLLGRDAAAPVAIRAWVAERLRLGKNRPDDPQILEAFECARTMEAERQATADPAPAAESKAQRIAAAIHRRTVVEGMPLGKALAETKREFEGPKVAPTE